MLALIELFNKYVTLKFEKRTIQITSLIVDQPYLKPTKFLQMIVI